MKKFLAIYYAPAKAMAEYENATQEQKLEGLKGWFNWKDSINGNLIDFGAPLMPGNVKKTQGEWASSNKQVSGYSIVQASDESAAKSLFDGHVHLQSHPENSIEIHEFAQIN